MESGLQVSKRNSNLSQVLVPKLLHTWVRFPLLINEHDWARFSWLVGHAPWFSLVHGTRSPQRCCPLSFSDSFESNNGSICTGRAKNQHVIRHGTTFCSFCIQPANCLLAFAPLSIRLFREILQAWARALPAKHIKSASHCFAISVQLRIISYPHISVNLSWTQVTCT